MDILNDIDGRDTEVGIQEEKYYDRVLLHKKFVIDAYMNLIENPASGLTVEEKPVQQYAEILKPIIYAHDSTKLEDEEFYPYRAKHNPTSRETYLYNNDEDYRQKVDELFNAATLHHLKHNSHHPEFWCFIDGTDELGVPRDMDIVSILHMLCDWQAMSYELGGSVKSYWQGDGKRHRAHMSDKTIEIWENLISQLPNTKYNPYKKGDSE